MAVAQLYTASPGDTITAARWNNEFGNIYNNGTAMAFPATTSISLNAQTMYLDAAGLYSLVYETLNLRVNAGLKVTGSTNVGTVVPAKHISGLTWNSSVADPVNDVNIAVGECASDDATAASKRLMVLATTITKRTDAVWAVGDNLGGLDTGVVGNNDYYIWLIQRADTGVVDALFSLSSTAPTMPTNYSFKRLIGWVKRTAGSVVDLYKTYELSGGGVEYLWTTPTIDVNLAATLTTTRRTDAVRVPLNFSTVARLTVRFFDAAAGGSLFLGCPDAVDVAPSTTNTIHANYIVNVDTYYERFVRTSATGTVASRASFATVDNYEMSTSGFTWGRR